MKHQSLTDIFTSSTFQKSITKSHLGNDSIHLAFKIVVIEWVSSSSDQSVQRYSQRKDISLNSNDNCINSMGKTPPPKVVWNT